MQSSSIAVQTLREREETSANLFFFHLDYYYYTKQERIVHILRFL